MPKRGRILYFLLAILLAVSLSYRIREISDRAGLLLHGSEHVRRPFSVAIPGFQITGVAPEAEAEGVRTGDSVLAVAGRQYRGAVDLFAPLRDALPGERLDVVVRSPSGETKNASIVLRSQPAPLPTEIALQITGDVMPVFCLALGFWVAAVRIADPLAWIFLLMMISFGESIGIGSFVSVFGHDDLLQPIVTFYTQLGANIWTVPMMLFGIYFPERVRIDRRFPWGKWLIGVPIVLRAAQIAISTMLAGKHAETAIVIDRFLNVRSIPIVFHMLAISYFFASIGDKTFTAGNPDARRRLRLLYTGATISMTPAFLVILVNVVSKRPPFEGTLATFTLFLMLIGFPLTMAYVIVVERAMDVRVVIRQGLQYVLASTGVNIMRIVLSAAAIVIATISSQDMTWPERLAVLATGLIAAGLIRKLAVRMRTWLDRRFFREAYDAEQILSELANKVRTIVETQPLLETVTHRISESLHIPRVAVLLNGGDNFRLAYALGYAEIPTVSIPSESSDLEQQAKRQLDAELVLPLSLNQNILGILSLGPKRSEEPYSNADVRLLGSVAAQTGLALENSRLTAEIAAEVAQRERMNREIEIAREVQERLFPQELPAIHGLDYAGSCRPASGVGGDYYDFLLLPDGKLGIAIGDVSGKGISAALLMASLRASLRGQTIQGAGDLAGLINNVNKLVYESSSSNRYATFFYAQYDPESRTIKYVNAGHNPPLVFRKSGEILRLESGGPVVGLLPVSLYEEATVALETGDVLVAFTDGISEAMNSAQQEWGEDRLIECVKDSVALPPQNMIQRIIGAADQFAAGAKQHDDMTIIVAVVKS